MEGSSLPRIVGARRNNRDMAQVWSDSPISTKKQDQFGRTEYAVHAANLIAASHRWDDSIVFGLTGSWGSGKSSMLAMITEELGDAHPAWKIAPFTPWATGDVNGLLGDFYASLGQVLPKNRGKQARQALGTLAHITAPTANLIPIAGGATAAAARAAGDALQQRTPWDKAFRDASEKLNQLKAPVLMVADDIDRLQTDELLALLRVVRLLGRFKGVHYLLAYDETTLFQSLSGANLVGGDRGAAARFMEKIVQYPLVVPPLLPTQLLRRLDAGLDEALAHAVRPALESRRLGRLEEVYRSTLATPRAIDRYLAQLRHHLPLLPPDEIDDEDVIVLTLLRTAFPTVYGQLPRWRKYLISGLTDEMKKGTSRLEFEEFDIEPLLEAVPIYARPNARALLYDLFPKVRPKGHQIGYADRTGRRICTEAYFDRYFAMGIPAHDISDIDVVNAYREAIEGDSTSLIRFFMDEDFDRVNLVLDKTITASEGLGAAAANDPAKLRLVRAAAAVVDSVPTRMTFFFSPRERVLRWAGKVVGELSDEAASDEVLGVIAGFSRLADQVSLAHFANRARDSGKPPACMPQVVARLGAQVADALLAQLRQRDDAPIADGIGWLTTFLVNYGFSGEVRDRIGEALDAGEFTIADLAARLISTPQVIGADAGPHLDDADQNLFDALAPARADEWFDSERIDGLDIYDLSWANRRAYAAGRLTRPPTPDAQDSPQNAADQP